MTRWPVKLGGVTYLASSSSRDEGTMHTAVKERSGIPEMSRCSQEDTPPDT